MKKDRLQRRGLSTDGLAAAGKENIRGFLLETADIYMVCSRFLSVRVTVPLDRRTMPSSWK